MTITQENLQVANGYEFFNGATVHLSELGWKSQEVAQPRMEIHETTEGARRFILYLDGEQDQQAIALAVTSFFHLPLLEFQGNNCVNLRSTGIGPERPVTALYRYALSEGLVEPIVSSQRAKFSNDTIVICEETEKATVKATDAIKITIINPGKNTTWIKTVDIYTATRKACLESFNKWSFKMVDQQPMYFVGNPQMNVDLPLTALHATVRDWYSPKVTRLRELYNEWRLDWPAE